MLYEAIIDFLNLLIPINNELVTWWTDYRVILAVVLTTLILYIGFIYPFIRFITYTMFGNSNKNKSLIGKSRSRKNVDND